tara:strand:- start:14773 stop:15369 length:597 start_codon:yes stop_codon:yes gene_type:complete
MKLTGNCKISKNGVFLDGEFQKQLQPVDENWKKEIYSKLAIDYPKFHKMDALAKMAFLSVEILTTVSNIDKFKDSEIALIFANNSSSQNSDLKYIHSYNVKGSPSPSLFVYTLPNILTGELAIRHKWYGENCFFIEEKFDVEFFLEQVKFYFKKGAKTCLCGWVNSFEDIEECLVFNIENKGTNDTILKEQLLTLYNQ